MQLMTQARREKLGLTSDVLGAANGMGLSYRRIITDKAFQKLMALKDELNAAEKAQPAKEIRREVKVTISYIGLSIGVSSSRDRLMPSLEGKLDALSEKYGFYHYFHAERAHMKRGAEQEYIHELTFSDAKQYEKVLPELQKISATSRNYHVGEPRIEILRVPSAMQAIPAEIHERFVPTGYDPYRRPVRHRHRLG